MTRVAVLGTGKMGGAIARRLEKGGLQVSVWDRTRSRAEALKVGRVADSPADAVEDADVVVSMVTGPQAVRDVYFGRGGVFEAAAKKTVVEMSTTGPDIGSELARAAERHGATLIEAPVMGSVPAVNAGTLVILASARQPGDLEAAQPVFDQLGEVRYVGDLGNAPALKLIANSMLAIISAGAAELVTAGTRYGLDADQVFSVLTRAAPGLMVREDGFIRGVHEPAMFAMRDILKDLDLGLVMYRGSSVPLTSLSRDLFAGIAEEAPGLDISAIVKAYPRNLPPEPQIDPPLPRN
jgi:3-hydroxyisobutyrate dehydrogenase-like beta-hydroxyacid dehydrogenase